MKQRSKETREAMRRAVLRAADYLDHPSMVLLPDNNVPHQVALSMYLIAQHLTAPGPLRQRREVMNDLQVAADYLSHPDVASLPFALSTTTVARALREVIRNLK